MIKRYYACYCSKVNIVAIYVYLHLFESITNFVKCFKCYCLLATLWDAFSLSFVNLIKDMTANYNLPYLRMIDKWLLIIRRPIVLLKFLSRSCNIKIWIIFRHVMFTWMTSLMYFWNTIQSDCAYLQGLCVIAKICIKIAVSEYC